MDPTNLGYDHGLWSDHALYMRYTLRKHFGCNFLNDEWIQNLEISKLFMLAFHGQQRSNACAYANTETINYLA